MCLGHLVRAPVHPETGFFPGLGLRKILQTLRVSFHTGCCPFCVSPLSSSSAKAVFEVELSAWLIFLDHLCPLPLGIYAWFLLSARLLGVWVSASSPVNGPLLAQPASLSNILRSAKSDETWDHSLASFTRSGLSVCPLNFVAFVHPLPYSSSSLAALIIQMYISYFPTITHDTALCHPLLLLSLPVPPTSARVDWIIFCYCFAPPRIQPPNPSMLVILTMMSYVKLIWLVFWLMK